MHLIISQISLIYQLHIFNLLNSMLHIYIIFKEFYFKCGEQFISNPFNFCGTAGNRLADSPGVPLFPCKSTEKTLPTSFPKVTCIITFSYI